VYDRQTHELRETNLKTLLSPATALAAVLLPVAANGGGTPTPPIEPGCCSVFELRQYTLHPGKRDELIDLFEREFVESQEEAGIHLVGQFRDLGDLNRFVWFRGFKDMQSRVDALTAFYGGPVWKAHREQANTTMIDSDNVLLLRPLQSRGFASLTARPSRDGASTGTAAVFLVTVYSLQPSTADTFPDFFERTLLPELRNTDVRLLATFATESAPNNFPRLPVREHERVFIWVARFDSEEVERAQVARLNQSRAWNAAQSALPRHLLAPTQQLRLQPTRRSMLR
jgi:quinol monooxygenase YgiN